MLLACGAVLLAGCGRDAPLSTDPAVATRQAMALFRKGMSENEATRTLRQKGFQVSRLESDSAPNHLLVATCNRRKHTWLIGLVVIHERVAACSVTVTQEQ